MIIFKGCPRCGGDVASPLDEPYCIQCGHRPGISELPFLGEPSSPVGAVTRGAGCPKCGRELRVRLDKLRPSDNTCYRCRLCGHIFSPAADDALPA